MYNIIVDGENRARGCANLDIPLEELLAKPMTEQVHFDDDVDGDNGDDDWENGRNGDKDDGVDVDLS